MEYVEYKAKVVPAQTPNKPVQSTIEEVRLRARELFVPLATSLNTRMPGSMPKGAAASATAAQTIMDAILVMIARVQARA